MSKIRKKPMTNKEVLIKLFKAKYKVYLGTKKEEDYFSVKFRENYKYDYVHRKRINHYVRNYLIPIDIYKSVVNKRFKPQFNIGDMIRVSPKSKRQRVRNQYNQVVGNSQNFHHLGMGSGKQYVAESIQDALTTQIGGGRGVGYGNYYYGEKYNNQILIGNPNYPANVLDSVNRAKAYFHMGYARERSTWRSSLHIQPKELIESIKIKGDGIFGPKQLINGYVTQVYVHFLYPKWNTKREARYKLTFDSGATGIWTNDYITRVYDTDYELDEKLMDGCPHMKYCGHTCDHKLVHMHTPECDTRCWSHEQGYICEPIFDYTNFFDTTHGQAKDLEDEDD